MRSQGNDKLPGTRPADIKRYLESLLDLRGDLVLVGRRLVVRPVRHVLRGAFLDRTSDKYSFRIWRCAKPLYNPPKGIGYGDFLAGAWLTWQPHFKPMLIDALAENVFPRVASIMTLSDLAEDLSDTQRFFTARVQALVLAGERDRAADYVGGFDRRLSDRWGSWVEEQRAFLARDIHEVCAEFHAQEAETVSALKIEEIWEPSPFPVEWPEHERHRVAERPFSTTPWIVPPPWLLGAVPDRPGDPRFAQDAVERRDGMALLVPLSRDEAEMRDRGGEPYVLAARTQDRLLVLLSYIGGWDRHDPRFAGVLTVRRGPPTLSFFSDKCLGYLSFFESKRHQGCLCLSQFSVKEPAVNERSWSCNIDEEEGVFRVWDDREEERKFSRQALTDADVDMVTCPVPPFGEFEDVLARMRAWLIRAGYGQLI